MEIKQLTFDENMELYFNLKEGMKVRLSISDGLYAFEENLTDSYKQRIVDFINDNTCWYEKTVAAVCEYGKENYSRFGIKAKIEDIELLTIFVLFEQQENPQFGLEFGTEYDREHGCGLKIDGTSFEIIEIGLADVAFC